MRQIISRNFYYFAKIAHNVKIKNYPYFFKYCYFKSLKEIGQANEYLADFPILKPLATVIHDRKIYRDVLADGKGVIEANNAKASNEFKALMQELSL